MRGVPPPDSLSQKQILESFLKIDFGQKILVHFDFLENLLLKTFFCGNRVPLPLQILYFLVKMTDFSLFFKLLGTMEQTRFVPLFHDHFGIKTA